jgi:hypothetical protein
MVRFTLSVLKAQGLNCLFSHKRVLLAAFNVGVKSGLKAFD